MKIGVVGSGLVGATAAYAIVMRGVGSELVLVDKDDARAKAEADDIFHAVPFAHPVRVRAGQYRDLINARVVIIAAGVNQQPGETRLHLLERNAKIFSQVVPSILEYAPDAILVVATNPVDVMTHLTAHFAAASGVPPSRVLGSGTTLDTARFRALLGNYVRVDPTHIHGYVLGEHGDSEVLAWSRTTVGVIPLEEFCQSVDLPLDESIKFSIDQGVRGAAYSIIEGKGATYYGIGSALARIVAALIQDHQAILTVCTPHQMVAGVEDVTIAMPHLVGGRGIMGQLPLHLNEQEARDLHKSASIVKQAIQDLNLS